MKSRVKQTIHFENVLSKFKAKGNRLLSYVVVFFCLFLLAGWGMNYIVSGKLSMFVPVMALIASFVVSSAFEEKWTVRLITKQVGTYREGEFLELIRHRNFAHPGRWVEKCNSAPVSASSLKMYRESGRYYLKHAMGDHIYDVFSVGSGCRLQFKDYCKETLIELCRLDKTKSTQELADLERLLDRVRAPSMTPEYYAATTPR